MSFGGHYRTFEIEPHHVFSEAENAGVDVEWARERAMAMVDGVSTAYSQAAADAELSGDSAVFAAEIIDRARDRAVSLKRGLERAQNPNTRFAAPGAAQPRNGDVGKPGNPGAFAAGSPPR